MDQFSIKIIKTHHTIACQILLCGMTARGNEVIPQLYSRQHLESALSKRNLVTDIRCIMLTLALATQKQ